MRFCFEHEDVTIHTTQIIELFGFPESTTSLHSLCYGTSDLPCCSHGRVAPGIKDVSALFRPPFTDGRDALLQILPQQPSFSKG
jgi:hypothetical protein